MVGESDGKVWVVAGGNDGKVQVVLGENDGNVRVVAMEIFRTAASRFISSPHPTIRV